MWIIPKTLSAYVPATAELSLELNELASMCEQSLMWRSKPSQSRTWLQRLNKVKWMQLLSGRILKPSMASHFVTKYTESLEVIPVSRSVMQGKEKEPKTPDTFSLIYANTYVQLDLFGASLKTSADTSIWDSTKFTKAFEIWVIMLRRDCLQRQRSARLIRENDCSSWPTPNATEGDRGCCKAKITFDVVGFHRESLTTGLNFGATLSAAINMTKNWGTPRSSDWKGSDRKDESKWSLTEQTRNWETPTVSRGGHTQKDGTTKPKLDQQVKNWLAPKVPSGGGCPRNTPGGGLRKLEDQVEVNWPSPTVAEGQKIGNNANYGQIALGNHPAIRGTVKRAKKDKGDGQPDQDNLNTNGKNRGQLNPAWVEQLMGLPPEWTNFDS